MTYDIGNNLMTSVNTNLNQVNYVYDAINCVVNINYPQQVNLNTTLIYDDCGVNNTVGFQSNTYTYDSSLDRLSKDKIINNGINIDDNQIYEYLNVNNQETHQISKIKNSNQLVLEDFTYDNNGNLIVHRYYNVSNGVSTLSKIETSAYDRMNRLKQVQIQDVINNTTQTVNYELNALGQRIEKNNSTLNSSNLFIYAPNNQIIAEYDQNDSIIKEYVYLNGVPIAFIQPKIISTSGGNVTVDELLYIYSDHLGTPRKITNKDNILQWSWNNIDPFGDSDPISNSNMEFNLRFPGQYYDQETKTNYNLFRDYNAGLGRYIQSDPIGLSGGLNSYAYAGQNPLTFSDPLGLLTSIVFIRNIESLNHVALMIDDKVYHISPSNFFAIFFQGEKNAKKIEDANSFLSQYVNMKIHSVLFININLSKKEENNLIKSFYEANDTYSIYYNNCASFINNILSKNNLSYPILSKIILSPSILEQWIRYLITSNGKKITENYIYLDELKIITGHFKQSEMLR